MRCLLLLSVLVSSPSTQTALAGQAVQTEDFSVSGPLGSDFGQSVASSGDTLVVGAKNQQRVRVYILQGTQAAQQAVFAAPDSGLSDWFGYVVDVDGDTVAVGAPLDNLTSGQDAGSVYMFTRTGTSWSFTQKLRASDGTYPDHFGWSLDLEGDRIAIGARQENSHGPHSGSVYVFERSGGTWLETAKLIASDGAAQDQFGGSVALSGDTVAVGALSAGPSGAVYVFTGGGSSWVEEAILTGSDSAPGDFMHKVALEGDTLLAGAPGHDAGGDDRGAAYVFTRSGTTWTEEAKLLAADPLDHATFGATVDLRDDRALIGAPQYTVEETRQGTAYLYVDTAGGWQLDRQLSMEQPELIAWLGIDVHLTQDLALCANQHDVLFGFDIGRSFPSFCDAGDGSLAACPCANPGDPDTGCDIQQGTGGIALTVTAQQTTPLNRATLMGTGYPVLSAPGVTVIRSTELDASAPVVFGDGLRCIGVPVVRVGAKLAADGVSVQTVGHGAAAGPGTFHYQLWVRNTPIMYCDPGAAFNLSNGRTLVW